MSRRVGAPPVWGPAAAGFAGGLCGFLASDLLPVEIASLWIPCAVLGAAVGRTRLAALPPLAAAVLAALWLLAAWTPLSAALVRDLPRRDALVSADAVVVLASRLQSDGEPTAVAQARLAHGVELVASGRAATLVVSELEPPAARAAPIARAWLARAGAEAVEVVGPGPVLRTRDEALAVAALGRERGWSRVIVVTSPLHSRRASAAFERAGLEVVSAPCPETRYDLESLDRPPERLRAFSDAVYERLAGWVYRWRGWA